MLRYSLRTLGAAVTGIAIGCAALLNAKPWVASTAWTLVFITLALASVATVLSAPDRRGFWTGFAVVGWLYLLVGIGPFSGYHNSSLLTTTALHRVATALPEKSGQVPANVTLLSGLEFLAIDATIPGNPVNRRSGWVSYPPMPSMTEPAQSFVQVGQAIWTVLLALLGGWCGAFIVARRTRAVVQTASSD